MPNPELPSIYTILSFDYGLRKIGVAVGDSLTQTAKPLAILPTKDGIVNDKDIENLISTWKPSVIVVGIPYNPLSENNTQNNQANRIVKLAQKFADQLENNYSKQYNLIVNTIDESHTSNEAKKIIADLRKNKQIKRGAKLDDIAACLILERWLQQH